VVTFAHDQPGTPAAAWTEHPRSAGLASLELDLDAFDRLVVLAAHPDDESLGAGGLIHRAHRRGLAILVVAATDGEGSHPASPTVSREELASIRRTELLAAVEELAPNATTQLLGLPDGSLAEHADELLTEVVGLVGDGRRTLLVAPWRHDGHPDHEALGRAAGTAAARTGAGLLEYPVWFWHWGRPDEAPWDRLRVVHLHAAEAAARARAQAAHVTQTEPLSDRAGDEALLSATFLDHFAGLRETYVVEPPEDTALDDLHAAQADPWGADSRWYEVRKRSLLLAALPRPRFRHGLEIGCSTGALAADLAPRCHRLLVVDSSAQAVASARSRFRGIETTRVEELTVPHEWPAPPAGGFDLIVLSEVGYFLSPRDLDELVVRIRASLADDGVLVLCHWRHPILGWPLDGADVHAVLTSARLRPVVASYRDRDVELLVLAHPSELPEPQGDA
jgi:LmbE family N-acetylglucosaminyl deacetylase/SAM-dependent methyltransferase